MIILWRKEKRTFKWQHVERFSYLKLSAGMVQNWWQDYLDHLWKVPEQIAAMFSADLYHLAAPGVVLFKFSKFLLMMKRTPFSTFQHVAPTKANLQEQWVTNSKECRGNFFGYQSSVEWAVSVLACLCYSVPVFVRPCLYVEQLSNLNPGCASN